MGHTVNFAVKVAAYTDFNAFWRTTTASRRDGCTRVVMHNTCNEKCTEKRVDATINEVRNKWPGSYTCEAWDCGILYWVVERKVCHIVNHKKVETTERKEYKTMPKRILKGGVLRAVHQYVVNYDSRDYDPYEHGEGL